MVVKYKNKLIEVHAIELRKNNFILHKFSDNDEHIYEKIFKIEMPDNCNYEKLFNNYTNSNKILDLSMGKLVL